MNHDFVDHRLIGALHVRALNRSQFDLDPIVERAAVQVGTIAALLDGRYEGDTTLAEVVAHADFGVGTVQFLDGELILFDGEAWVATADGAVNRVPLSTKTPFVVACTYRGDQRTDLRGIGDVATLVSEIELLTSNPESVVAVRVTGEFAHVRLRSVARQYPPFVALNEVVAHQSQWTLESSFGSIIGFRFPDAIAGIEVPGVHLHYLADDRLSGGHLVEARIVAARVEIDVCDELRVELPVGVTLGRPGDINVEEIVRLEGPGDAHDT